MKKPFFSAAWLFFVTLTQAQSVPQRLQKAWEQFSSDSQLRYAAYSLYVTDAATGQLVFDKNSRMGLAPASTQKIITSVTAFELLGPGYRYQTTFGIREENGRSILHIRPSGDPTLGSWRWENSNEQTVLAKIKSLLATQNKPLSMQIQVAAANWSSQSTPDGWIWQDIGNYYGAGASFFNWRENQYDLLLKSGKKTGDSVQVAGTQPPLYAVEFESELRAAVKGSGDNAYIYLPADGKGTLVLRGTIPVDEERFKISGAMPSPLQQFSAIVAAQSKESFSGSGAPAILILRDSVQQVIPGAVSHFSPPLDSIIYWFNKKSINLYGEALLKTMANEKKGRGATETGTALVRGFWKEKGLDPEELNLYDGSGLSPLNRVTTHAQVEILQYAKSREWFPAFLQSLPEYNGMSMKSGTISDVKGFCGYHKAKDGKEYIFSFLVNNYSGRSSALVGKMYRVLDVLK